MLLGEHPKPAASLLQPRREWPKRLPTFRYLRQMPLDITDRMPGQVSVNLGNSECRYIRMNFTPQVVAPSLMPPCPQSDALRCDANLPPQLRCVACLEHLLLPEI